MKRLVVMLLCVFAAALSLTACGSNRTPQELRIEVMPQQHYIQGAPKQEFLDSLNDGYVVIRYTNATTSDRICLNDTNKLTVTGFSSETPGTKHITIKLNGQKVSAQYSIEIAPIEIDSFIITRAPGVQGEDGWEEFSYFADCKLEDISVDGGLIKITNNDGTIQNLEMKDNVKVVSSLPYTVSTEEGSKLFSEIVIQVIGTHLISKFVVELIEVVPQSYKIQTPPKYRFYKAGTEISKIITTGISIEITTNSGSKYLISDTESAGITIGSVDYDQGKVSLNFAALAEENRIQKFDIIVLDEGILVDGYMDSLDWQGLAELPEEDALAAIKAFTELSRLTAQEIAAYSLIKHYEDDIVAAAFYANARELILVQHLIEERLLDLTQDEEDDQDTDPVAIEDEILSALCEDFMELYQKATTKLAAFDAFKQYTLYTLEPVGGQTEVKKVTIGDILDTLASTAEAAPSYILEEILD